MDDMLLYRTGEPQESTNLWDHAKGRQARQQAHLARGADLPEPPAAGEDTANPRHDADEPANRGEQDRPGA